MAVKFLCGVGGGGVSGRIEGISLPEVFDVLLEKIQLNIGHTNI